MKGETSTGGSHADFRDTLWTVVREAGGRSRESLEALIRRYWKPIYFFIRRRGHGVEEAKDLTQGFFAFVLQTNVLRTADPARGRFRTFLLAVLKHHLSGEKDRAVAQKRGGRAAVLSMDCTEAERDFEPVSNETPEREFHRRWAREVIDRALGRLQEEHPGKPFEALRAYLVEDPPSYRELAAALDLTESAVDSRLRRMRKRLQELIFAEARDSVASSKDLREELRDLMDFL